MKGARVRRIRLNYGNQRDAIHEIPQGGEPVIIAGANGSGKTTLLEAVVRTLFGFNRRADEDKELLDARLESLETGWCELRMIAPDGAMLDIRRSFDDAKAVITDAETDEERFKGDANPGGTNEQSRRFQQAIRDVVGMGSYDEFRKTAFAEQGRLVETRLDRSLVQVASGGAGGVDEAKATIHERFRKLTVEKIDEDGSRAHKNRALENLRDRQAELREALAGTAEKERRRGPLAEEIHAIDEEMGGLSERLARLEAAQEAVLSKDERATRAKLMRNWQGQGEDARTELEEARTKAERARESFAGLDVNVPPSEVPKAAAAVRQALAERAEAERRREEQMPDPAAVAGGSGAAWGGGLIAATGVAAGALALVGEAGWLWAVAVVLLFAGVAAAVRAISQRRAAEAEAEKARAGLEDAVETAGARVREEAALLGLADIELSRIEQELGRVEGAAAAVAKAEEEHGEKEAAVRHTLDTLTGELDDEVPDDLDLDAGISERLRTLEEHFRREQVRLELREEEGAVDLPDDVEATPKAVKTALASARERKRELERRRDERRQELLQEATPARSTIALREELGEIAAEIERVQAKISALRLAHELLGQAYDEFREGDEQRLLDRISARATELSHGQLGPVETDGALEEAQIRVLGRVMPLHSPGLSYGERVAISLALRLGSTDFLARNGIRPPLLLDEPFDDLDPERATGVWALLERIAEERQVILTSQNPLTLGYLGIEPDIELERTEP